MPEIVHNLTMERLAKGCLCPEAMGNQGQVASSPMAQRNSSKYRGNSSIECGQFCELFSDEALAYASCAVYQQGCAAVAFPFPFEEGIIYTIRFFTKKQVQVTLKNTKKQVSQ